MAASTFTTSSRLAECWRIQDCKSCLHSSHGCGWCPVVGSLPSTVSFEPHFATRPRFTLILPRAIYMHVHYPRLHLGAHSIYPQAILGALQWYRIARNTNPTQVLHLRPSLLPPLSRNQRTHLPALERTLRTADRSTRLRVLHHHASLRPRHNPLYRSRAVRTRDSVPGTQEP